MALIAGLLFPGLGQWVRGEGIAGLFVMVGSFTPVCWTALILNQLVNERVARLDGEPPLSVLSGAFLGHLSDLQGLPPEVMWFGALGVGVYLLGALAAYGPGTSG